MNVGELQHSEIAVVGGGERVITQVFVVSEFVRAVVIYRGNACDVLEITGVTHETAQSAYGKEQQHHAENGRGDYDVGNPAAASLLGRHILSADALLTLGRLVLGEIIRLVLLGGLLRRGGFGSGFFRRGNVFRGGGFFRRGGVFLSDLGGGLCLCFGRCLRLPVQRELFLIGCHTSSLYSVKVTIILFFLAVSAIFSSATFLVSSSASSENLNATFASA